MRTIPYVFLFAPASVVILILIWREAARRGFGADSVAAAMAACAAGAAIGSKVIMFDFHTPEYGEKTFLGAVVGGVLTLAIVTRALAFDARAFDVPVLPVLWGAAIGRVGCFLAGCCHGLPTTVPWGIRYAPGSSAFNEHVVAGLITPSAASSLPIHPTQLYESVLDVALAIILIRLRGRFRRPGSLALAGAVGASFIRFAVDSMRATSVPGPGLTVVQWTTLAVMVVAGLTLVRRERFGVAAAYYGPPRTAFRHAPLSVLAAVVALTLATKAWLTPLELALVTSVSFAAAFVVMRSVVPRIVLSSPIVGAAVFLPLQGKDPASDTLPVRTFIALGGSAMGGGYEVTTEDCAGNTLTRTQHSYQVGGLSAEVRQEREAGVGTGFRIGVFHGRDKAPAATIVNPQQPPAPSDTARTDMITGVSGTATVDWRHVGFTGGIAAGSWTYHFDRPLVGNTRTQVIPVAALRLGPVRGLHGEIGIGTHQPAPAPGPVVRAGLAFGDSTGTKAFRVGVSDVGAYIGARALSGEGFEFEPSLSFGSARQFQLGLTVKKRIYLKR